MNKSPAAKLSSIAKSTIRYWKNETRNLEAETIDRDLEPLERGDTFDRDFLSTLAALPSNPMFTRCHVRMDGGAVRVISEKAFYCWLMQLFSRLLASTFEVSFLVLDDPLRYRIFGSVRAFSPGAALHSNNSTGPVPPIELMATFSRSCRT